MKITLASILEALKQNGIESQQSSEMEIQIFPALANGDVVTVTKMVGNSVVVAVERGEDEDLEFVSYTVVNTILDIIRDVKIVFEKSAVLS